MIKPLQFLTSFTFSPVPDSLRLCLHSPSYGSSKFKLRKVDLVIGWVNRFRKKADSYAQGIRDHVSWGPKITDTLKGKLGLGTRILQAEGIEKVFRRSFSRKRREVIESLPVLFVDQCRSYCRAPLHCT